MQKIAAVILAAGKGTRMNEGLASPIPKVMFKINDVPMICHSLNTVKGAGIDRITVVVGYKAEIVKEYLGEEVNYALQAEQLGTGHAVASAKDSLAGKSDLVLVSYGDMPLFLSETIRGLIEKYKEEKPTIALLSVDFNEPEKWAYGRVVRDSNGNVERIIEQKDCTDRELKINESNTGVYLFDASWLWQHIGQLKNENKQNEYYLTDLIEMARAEGRKVIAYKVRDEYEALGVNNPEQRQIAERVLRQRSEA